MPFFRLAGPQGPRSGRNYKAVTASSINSSSFGQGKVNRKTGRYVKWISIIHSASFHLASNVRPSVQPSARPILIFKMGCLHSHSPRLQDGGGCSFSRKRWNAFQSFSFLFNTFSHSFVGNEPCPVMNRRIYLCTSTIHPPSLLYGL